MKRLPQRTSLVAQTVEVMREAITEGQWPRWLPGELELTQRLHVSRVTLRTALAQLERAKLIRAGQGRRREIIAAKSTRAVKPANRAVVLLSPMPLHRLPTSTIFWMDELREHLDTADWPLEIVESAAAYRRRPAHALEELAARRRPAGWVLYRSTPEMQRWFVEHGDPTVIAGSRHPGIDLIAVDEDYTACCRHAAGRFLANGHERLAIVRPNTGLAGDLESVSGFEAGVGLAVPAAVHDGTARGIARSLVRLFAQKPHPTGLLVFHAAHLLGVLGWLQQQELRVPRDVSVVCRDDEPFLESVIPSVARYSLSAAVFARKVSRIVASVVSGGSAPARQHRILPTFVGGETLGKAPA